MHLSIEIMRIKPERNDQYIKILYDEKKNVP